MAFAICYLRTTLASHSGRRSRSRDKPRSSDTSAASAPEHGGRRKRKSSLKKKLDAESEAARSVTPLPPVQAMPLQPDRPPSRRRRRSSASRSSSRDTSTSSIEAIPSYVTQQPVIPTFEIAASRLSSSSLVAEPQQSCEQKDVSPLAQSSPQIEHRDFAVVHFPEELLSNSPESPPPAADEWPSQLEVQSHIDQTHRTPHKYSPQNFSQFNAASGDKVELLNALPHNMSNQTVTTASQLGTLNPVFEETEDSSERVDAVTAASRKQRRKGQDRARRAHSQEASRMPPMFGVSSDSIIFMDDTLDTDKYHISSKRSFKLTFARPPNTTAVETEL